MFVNQILNNILLEGLGDPYAAPDKKRAELMTPTSYSAPDPGKFGTPPSKIENGLRDPNATPIRAKLSTSAPDPGKFAGAAPTSHSAPDPGKFAGAAPTSHSAPDPGKFAGAAPPPVAASPGQTVAQMQSDTSRRSALDALHNQDTQNTKGFIDTVKDKAHEYGGQVADFATKHSDALMGAGVGAAAAGLGYLAYKKMKAAKEARA